MSDSEYEFEENPFDNNSGYFDDDGNRLYPDLIIKPPLCISCIFDDDPSQEIECNLTRLDQKNEALFECFAYKSKSNYDNNSSEL